MLVIKTSNAKSYGAIKIYEQVQKQWLRSTTKEAEVAFHPPPRRQPPPAPREAGGGGGAPVVGVHILHGTRGARWLRVHAVGRAPPMGASASWACVPACGCRGAVWTRRRPRLPPALNHLRNLREELQSAYLLYMLWSTKKEIILLGNHVLVQIEMEMQWGSWAPTASSAWAHRRQLCPIMIAALVMASTKAHTASDCTSLRLPLPQLVQDRRKRDLHKIS
jgi:hypothetical protein